MSQLDIEYEVADEEPEVIVNVKEYGYDIDTQSLAPSKEALIITESLFVMREKEERVCLSHVSIVCESMIASLIVAKNRRGIKNQQR